MNNNIGLSYCGKYTWIKWDNKIKHSRYSVQYDCEYIFCSTNEWITILNFFIVVEFQLLNNNLRIRVTNIISKNIKIEILLINLSIFTGVKVIFIYSIIYYTRKVLLNFNGENSRKGKLMRVVRYFYQLNK